MDYVKPGLSHDVTIPATIKTYVSVAKPAIVLGNMMTATAGFLLACRGSVDWTMLGATISGISLVVAAGCVFNNCIDRDLDRKMARTRGRALAEKRMTPRTAVHYASVLGLIGSVLIERTAGVPALVVVLAGLGIYAGWYSLYLKRNSVHATWIGSLAGAAPPIAGYCAVTHRFDTGALMLLAIFCLWQVPHSYAIAMARFDDYSAAAVPVLPVTAGVPATRKSILATIGLFALTAPMLTVAGYTGYGYLVVTGAAGLAWLLVAGHTHSERDDRGWAKKVFVGSIVMLVLLSIMMAFDHPAPPLP